MSLVGAILEAFAPGSSIPPYMTKFPRSTKVSVWPDLGLGWVPFCGTLDQTNSAGYKQIVILTSRSKAEKWATLTQDSSVIAQKAGAALTI